ncbi:hypothetical protein [Vibrio diazotrophicus]|uniref:hypothetical protein n=1 Tax=Vibrio diazotrophicus TaxID=685 RepID=UPI000C9EB0B4|nr:hypothetical protein [Vibrio diazotrophicus]PNH95200.1 hypothetical protein C1O24_16650 [Vibrio diazotrophicus]
MKPILTSEELYSSRNSFNFKEATPKNSTNAPLKVNRLGKINQCIESATGEIVEIREISGVKLEPHNRNKTALLIFQLTPQSPVEQPRRVFLPRKNRAAVVESGELAC